MDSFGFFDTEVIGLSYSVTCMVGCISCYTGAYFPFLVVEMIVFSHSFHDLLYLIEGHSFTWSAFELVMGKFPYVDSQWDSTV